MLFLSRGGVRAPEPKLFVRNAAPFCFFAATRKTIKLINYLFDVKKTIVGKKEKKRDATSSTVAFSTLLSTWDTIPFHFQDFLFPEKPGISTLPTRDETSPRKRHLPPLYRPVNRLNETIAEGNFIITGRNKFVENKFIIL